MLRDFRRINPSSARVILVEGRERVLPTYSLKLSTSAQAQLAALGVEVITNAIVTSIDAHRVRIRKTDNKTDIETDIPTRTVLWAAGVEASPLAKSLGVPLDRAGRVPVQPDLSIPGHDNVFVIGDLAALQQSDGTLVPGVAPAAIQGGQHAAANIDRATRRGERAAAVPLPRQRVARHDRPRRGGRRPSAGRTGRAPSPGGPGWPSTSSS